MDSCRDGTEGIPICWISQPSVLKQFSVNCSCTAKLSHSPSRLRRFYTSPAAPSLRSLPSPISVPVRHFALPYHKEDAAGRRAYITYMYVYLNCVCTQRASGFSPCSLGSRRARKADKLQQASVRRRKAQERAALQSCCQTSGWGRGEESSNPLCSLSP